MHRVELHCTGCDVKEGNSVGTHSDAMLIKSFLCTVTDCDHLCTNKLWTYMYMDMTILFSFLLMLSIISTIQKNISHVEAKILQMYSFNTAHGLPYTFSTITRMYMPYKYSSTQCTYMYI